MSPARLEQAQVESKSNLMDSSFPVVDGWLYLLVGSRIMETQAAADGLPNFRENTPEMH